MEVSRSQGDAEANGVILVAGLVPYAISGPAARGGNTPGAAAEDAFSPEDWAAGVLHTSTRKLAVPVLAPFPNVAVQVVEAPAVCFFLPDDMRLTAAVGRIPGAIIELSVAISTIEARGDSRATGKFPFGFSWQTIVEISRQSLSFGGVQFLQPVLAIVPTDLFNGEAVSAKVTRFRVQARGGLSDGGPFLLRNGECTQPKTMGDRDVRLRSFVVGTACFVDRASHPEAAWADPLEFNSAGRDDKVLPRYCRQG